MRALMGRRAYLSIIPVLLQSHFSSKLIVHSRFVNPITSSLRTHFVTSSSFPTSDCCGSRTDPSPNVGNDEEDEIVHSSAPSEDFEDERLISGAEEIGRGASIVLHLIRDRGLGPSDLRSKLGECSGIALNSELVVEVLSQLRNDWESAFTFFVWAGEQPDYAHTLRAYHSMIYILGKMRKFDTAWSLIDEMRGVKTGRLSMVTPQTLLIMIRRYSAVHDVGRAINTFYAHKKFQFDIGIETFQGLLSALCRYGNVQDAEHLLFCNRNAFPFNTKSFNIILNGWCNVIGSQREGERFWMEMGKRGIPRDVVSYASMMSCYSKVKNLNKVLRLFDQMKALKIAPDRKVYNAVIHALAKSRFVPDARNLMKTMEEKGIAPDVVSYNSLILPLCKVRKIDEAREVFDEMLQRRLSPSVRTFHAFFRILRTAEEVFAVLEKMKKMGGGPNIDTYIMLIRKFSRWRQFDSVFKLWSEMSDRGICPDRSSYIVLIHGLFLNGKVDEAYRYYEEMKEKLLMPEPMLDEMFHAWVLGKQNANCDLIGAESKKEDPRQSVKTSQVVVKKFEMERDFHRQPETRTVTRERGFSFWGQ